MGFFQSGYRARLPAGVSASVFPVGWRVRVACADGGPATVALTDEAGTDGVTSLASGSEVEILAWLPRGPGTRYRVRSTNDGLEGWLPSGNLRRMVSAIASGAGKPMAPDTRSRRLRTQKPGAATPRVRKRGPEKEMAAAKTAVAPRKVSI